MNAKARKTKKTKTGATTTKPAKGIVVSKSFVTKFKKTFNAFKGLEAALAST